AAGGSHFDFPGCSLAQETGALTMRLANIFHLGIKEIRGLLHDPIMLILIIYAFTFAVHTSATAMPETLHKAPIAIVDEDRSQLSQRIADAFFPPHFMPPARISQAEMDARMDAGIDTFAINIPSDFQRDVLAGHTPAIQLNVDATRMSQAFTGNSYIQTIITGEVTTFLQGHRSNASSSVDLVLRSRFNPELNKAWFGAVMKVIDNVTMLS
ncbi:ABC transporter permease, partial [Desulfosarcina cetonica]